MRGCLAWAFSGLKEGKDPRAGGDLCYWVWGVDRETLISENRVGVGRKRKWRKGKAEEVKLVSGELCPHRELSLSGSYPAGSQADPAVARHL